MNNSDSIDPGNLEPLGRYYAGEIATSYEEFRRASKSWQAEDAAIEHILDSIALSKGSVVLDVPVGTGRFLPTFARRSLAVIGVDVSADMVHVAQSRAEQCNLADAEIRTGDATALDLPDNSVDLALSVRFLVHLEIQNLETVLRELARVSRRYVIAHVRIRRPGLGPTISRWLRHELGRFRTGAGSGEGSARAIKVADKRATMHRREDLEACWRRCGLELVSDLTVNRTSRGYASHILLFAIAS